MLRLLPIPVLVAIGTPAAAHVGHLGDVAGHDHWVAGAAIGAAVVIGLYGALKGRRKVAGQEQDPPRTEPDQTEEEAGA
jgi:hypothetical protein